MDRVVQARGTGLRRSRRVAGEVRVRAAPVLAIARQPSQAVEAQEIGRQHSLRVVAAQEIGAGVRPRRAPGNPVRVARAAVVRPAVPRHSRDRLRAAAAPSADRKAAVPLEARAAVGPPVAEVAAVVVDAAVAAVEEVGDEN